MTPSAGDYLCCMAGLHGCVYSHQAIRTRSGRSSRLHESNSQDWQSKRSCPVPCSMLIPATMFTFERSVDIVAAVQASLARDMP